MQLEFDSADSPSSHFLEESSIAALEAVSRLHPLMAFSLLTYSYPGSRQQNTRLRGVEAMIDS